MDIKLVSENEIDNALDLILRVFMEFEAPDYSGEGVDSFVNDIIKNDDFRKGCLTGQFKMYGAFDGKKIVAVMTMRKTSHIMLAFVDRDYQRQGIGKRLFEYICNDIRSNNDDIYEITVNSSPYGEKFYTSLRFIRISEEQEKHGIKYIPMVYKLKAFNRCKDYMNNIALGDRTEETVRIYFEKAQKPAIKAVLPQKATTVEEAIADYHKSLLPTANSFGKTILVNGEYIGDIWCYCINSSETPNAMLSYCIFDENYWNKGIATGTTLLFLEEIKNKFNLKSIGAFTYSNNLASIKVLEKTGFDLVESFEEDGRESKYFQKCL